MERFFREMIPYSPWKGWLASPPRGTRSTDGSRLLNKKNLPLRYTAGIPTVYRDQQGLRRSDGPSGGGRAIVVWFRMSQLARP